MKKLAVLGAVVVIALIVILGTTYKEINTEYLRIHIRANSNLEVDQNVKYKIKDQVVLTLTPLIASCDSFESVKKSRRGGVLEYRKRAAIRQSTSDCDFRRAQAGLRGAYEPGENLRRI